METSYNFSAIANGKTSSNNNANNNSVNDDDEEVLALPSLEQKFDPMMDSGDSDLPDLEELPAPGGTIEVSLTLLALYKIAMNHLTEINAFEGKISSTWPAKTSHQERK